MASAVVVLLRTVAALIVRDANGTALVERSGSTWRLPFGTPLHGTYPIVAKGPSELCSADTWRASSGVVVLGGGFATAGCSREQRARLALSANATGVLFAGQLHSPFDWDGSQLDELSRLQTGLADRPHYDDVYDAVRNRGGIWLTIDATPSTPLLDLAFASAQWVVCVLLLILIGTNVCYGLWKHTVMMVNGEKGMGRVVIATEALSQSCLFVFSLAGPGFDLTHKLLYPNLCYRLFFSLYFDLHILGILLVSKQLRYHIDLLERGPSSFSGELDRGASSELSGLSISTIVLGARSCWQRVIDGRHELMALAVVVYIVLELILAVMDGLYVEEASVLSGVVTIVNSLFFVLMGVYYVVMTLRIQRMLADGHRHLSHASQVRLIPLLTRRRPLTRRRALDELSPPLEPQSGIT